MRPSAILILLVWTPAVLGSTTIMPMGDSITVGYQGAADIRGSYREELGHIFGLLHMDVDFVGNFKYAPRSAIDGDMQAVSGYTVEKMIDEYGPAVASLKPDIVLLLAGTNNHWDQPVPGEFLLKYSTLIDLIHTNSADTQVISSTIPAFGCCREIDYWTEAFVSERNDVRIPMMNTAISTIAENDGSVAMVDLHGAIDTSSHDLIEGDWVHLTGAGQKKLAQLYFAELGRRKYNLFSIDNLQELSNIARVGTNDLSVDFDASGLVDEGDVQYAVTNIAETWIGDADWDGEFSSSDLVSVFMAGQYEDSQSLNSTWDTGDWNADGDFTADDFIAAFEDAGYEHGLRSAVNAVPEPMGSPILSWLAWSVSVFARRSMRRNLAACH